MFKLDAHMKSIMIGMGVETKRMEISILKCSLVLNGQRSSLGIKLKSL